MLEIKFFTFSPIQENTYVLYNENNECIIVDPGTYFDDEKDTLKGFISDHKLVPKALINTHCHLDHTFGNKYFAELYDLKLQLHPEEEAVLQFGPASGLMYDMPFDNYNGDLIFLNDGDIIKLGSDEIEVIHAPGHSPGSICFYCKAQKFLIGGDVLFNRSIGRTDLPMGNHELLLSSIREKLFTLPDDVTVYSGHGRPTTIGEEKQFNPFL